MKEFCASPFIGVKIGGVDLVDEWRLVEGVQVVIEGVHGNHRVVRHHGRPKNCSISW